MAKEISHAKKNVDNYLISITSAWNKAAFSIIEVGRQLNEAQNELSKNQWVQLRRELEDQRIMSNSTITKLKMIANNVVLTREENQKYLPPSYETLYVLSQVEDDELSKAFDDHQISTETQRKNIPEIVLYPEFIVESFKDPTALICFSGKISKDSFKKPESIKSCSI